MNQAQTRTTGTHKVIEVLTVPPVFALITLSWLYSIRSLDFGGAPWYLVSVLFLAIIPASPYILGLFPYFRGTDRKTQRRIAFLVGVPSYAAGTVISYILKAPRIIKVIFLSYFWSGLILLLVNGVFKFRASGHACGVAGPLALVIRFARLGGLLFSLVLPLIFWSRLKMRRHTLPELLVGSLIGLAATTAVLLMVPV